MQCINVVGTSSSGKSTFSCKLAASLNYPYYEMDALFWKPDWGESTDEEFFAAVENATAEPCWVLDGNYSRTVPIKWAKVDTVIWIDYSLTRTILQALKRAVSRCLSQQELWAGTGNTESFRKTFMSRDSVLLWTLKSYKKIRRRYLGIMAAAEYNHIRFIRLRNPKEANSFIADQRAMQRESSS